MIADLRSDTFTVPTPQMLEHMMKAQVGDDVFGEDPSINALQDKVADMFGYERALFVPSGTMANQIAIKVHTQPGDEVICDRLSHVYNYEGGGIAFNSGASVRLLEGKQGIFNADDVEAAIHGNDSHLAHTQLVVIENTVNKGGGSIWPMENIKAVQKVCHKNRLNLHLDGARLFNAMIETGEKPKDFGSLFDSISICLSKGLGAPVGSVLMGSSSFINKAHRIRKVMGGGMRQAGYLAAAGSFALDHHVERLAVDHARAKKIASRLVDMEVVTRVLPVHSNIVLFDLDASRINANLFLEQLKKQGVLAYPFGPYSVRFVTHLDLNDAHMNMIFNALTHMENVA
jgi:threonine aldolase